MQKSWYEILKTKISVVPREDYPTHSRTHSLQSINGIVKRDDELGFGVTGSKIRKYQTLLPFLKNYKKIALIGGAQSNHILGLTQLLLENKLKPKLFLRGPRPNSLRGNQYLLNLLIGNKDIQWISRNEWANVQKLAFKFLGDDKETIIVPEGGALLPSLIGALSLVIDLVESNQLDYDNIICDAGTGITAIALLLGLSFLKLPHQTTILLVAGTKEEFDWNVKFWHQKFEKWLGFSCPYPKNYLTYYPSTARSFGAVNQTLIEFIKEFISQEGLLIDPIYSGKLFYFAKQYIKMHKTQKSLIIHSGGGFSLFGFQEKMIKRC